MQTQNSQSKVLAADGKDLWAQRQVIKRITPLPITFRAVADFLSTVYGFSWQVFFAAEHGRDNTAVACGLGTDHSNDVDQDQ